MTREKRLAFLSEIIEVCQKHKARLIYAGCGTHKIWVEEALIGTDLLEDFYEEDSYFLDHTKIERPESPALTQAEAESRMQ